MQYPGIGVFRLEWPILETADVIRLMGHGAETPDSPELIASAAEAVRWCREAKISPLAAGGRFTLKDSPEGHATLGGRSGLGFRVPGRFLEGASHLYVGAATIGPELEAESARRFAAGDPVIGYLLDAMATEGLRRITDAFYRGLRDQIRAGGMIVGPRFFPGCHGIPLDAQKAVFALLPVSAIGMELTNSLVMKPGKSVSFVVPYGKNVPGHIESMDACTVCESRGKCLREEFPGAR